MTWFAVNLMATRCRLCLYYVQLASFRSCTRKSMKEHLFELLKKTVGDVKEEDRGNTVSSRPHLYFYSAD